MNHATIIRFTPQSQESRHKETADKSWAQNSLNSLFPAFFREHMKEAPNSKMAENDQWQCVHCGEALQDIFNFCPECGKSVAQEGEKTEREIIEMYFYCGFSYSFILQLMSKYHNINMSLCTI